MSTRFAFRRVTDTNVARLMTVALDAVPRFQAINASCAFDIKKNLQKAHFNDIRKVFLRYVLKIDSGRLGIPTNAVYSQISNARANIECLTAPGK
jgi:hypothetical protein